MGGSQSNLTLQSEGAGRVAQGRWARYLLWSLLALAVSGLAWMTWRLSVQLRQTATHAEPKGEK